jgi:hypothetical protein
MPLALLTGRAPTDLPLACRPRRLLVFVNPVGGCGAAPHVWRRVAEPVLQDAGVTCEVVHTRAPVRLSLQPGLGY